MDRAYQELPLRELAPGAGLRRPQQPRPARGTVVSVPTATDVLGETAPRMEVERGIFPASQLVRQLGLLLPQAGGVARTFAEIEAALGR
jgi:hypothetical protein